MANVFAWLLTSFCSALGALLMFTAITERGAEPFVSVFFAVIGTALVFFSFKFFEWHRSGE